MVKKSALGKGLGSLISETTIEAGVEEALGTTREIPIEKIVRNEDQPRKNFDEEELEQLSNSIKEVGILQPILVRKLGDKYQIVAGERRFQAAKNAGLKNVPVVIRETDDDEALELALIENIQRSDLNAIEEALAYREIIERTSVTQEELSRRLSKSRSAIANSLRLLDLPDEICELIVARKLTAGHARAILSLEDEEQRIPLAKRVCKDGLSVRETEAIATRMNEAAPQKKSQRSIPKEYAAVASSLKESLGRKVAIKPSRGKYKLEIEFSDDDDLARVLNSIGFEAVR